MGCERRGAASQGYGSTPAQAGWHSSEGALRQLIAAQANVCDELDAALLTTVTVEQREELLEMRENHCNTLKIYKSWLRPTDTTLGGVSPPDKAPRLSRKDGKNGAEQSPVSVQQEPMPADLKHGSGHALNENFLLEAGGLMVCALLALHTYSGPRSIFATSAIAVGLHFMLSARGDNLSSASASRPTRLRPRLALMYLSYWSLETTHLGLTASVEDAVSVATNRVNNQMALTLAFGLLTAVCCARSPTHEHAHRTMGTVTLAQAVLGLRVYLIWRMLRIAWTPAAAAEYVWAAAWGQLLLPLVTMFLTHVVGWHLLLQTV